MASEIYLAAERPDILVLWEGRWCEGELRGWWDRDGRRLCNVQFRPEPGMTRLETVEAARVRPAPRADSGRS